MPTLKPIARLVREVFENPTAPYRETWVLQHIKNELKRLKVPYFEDSWGNVISGTKNPAELKNSRRIALMAHTDHPGFHIVKKIRTGTWSARWYGGCPPHIGGSKVAIHNPALPGSFVSGKVVSLKLGGKDKRDLLIKLDNASDEAKLNSSCFGAFQFGGFVRKGTRIYTRAADDLAGVAIILGTLERLGPAQRRHVLGIFTRAEEVGFRGALGIIYKNILGPKNMIISLEASRQLPGARMGQGPVIRLGDKRTLFDSFVTSRLDQAAAHLQKRSAAFRFQRRIMNGGTCEATPFNLHNIKASGIAVPLGNYHNQRPSGKPGPEFIDIRDVEGAIKLCVEFYNHTAKKIDPVTDFLTKLESEFGKDVPLLKARIPFKERTM